ncbi:hypothetical protein PLESTF_001498500 [Pleodorina starrii]|nr:hypothetical protein PLESTF_001498500 [Pleodorina starrii]
MAAEAVSNGGDMFDLMPRLVRLGDAAFQAYCDPKPAHGGFEEVRIPDMTILFLDKEYLRNSFQGVLEVKLISAENIPPRAPERMLDAPNPYALVSLRHAGQPLTRPYKLRSDNVRRNPAWPKAPPMYFPVRNRQTDLLRIGLCDEGPRARQSRLGTLFGISEYEPEPLCSKELALDELFQHPADMTAAGAVDVREEGRTKDKTDDGVRVETHTKVLQLGGGENARVRIQFRWLPREAVSEAVLDAMTNVYVRPMSWDAPMEIGLNVVQWLRASEYEDVGWRYLKDVMDEAARRHLNQPDGGRGIVGHLRPMAFIECLETETAAWVFYEDDGRRRVVAKMPSWLTDMAVLDMMMPGTADKETIARRLFYGLVGLIPAAISNVVIIPPSWRKRSTWPFLYHAGFMKAYQSVREAVRRVIFDIVLPSEGQLSFPGEGPWELEMTGHSLGGALATLAAHDIWWDARKIDKISNMAMVAFGSPRVGNKVFADYFKDTPIIDAWRVHNVNDIVTR